MEISSQMLRAMPILISGFIGKVQKEPKQTKDPQFHTHYMPVLGIYQTPVVKLKVNFTQEIIGGVWKKEPLNIRTSTRGLIMQ